MKIHIVQRDDTFESIADKYSVSVQDLVGMNTHINHLAPLVSGLKVKVPSPARKEAPNVAQHIQKYYPNIDTETIDLQTASTVEPVTAKKVQPVPVVKKVVPTEAVTQQATVTPTQVVEQQVTVIPTQTVPQQAAVIPTQVVTQQAAVQQPIPVTEVEEVIPIPLKPLPTEVEPITGPNDGIKIAGTQKSVEEFKVSVNKGYFQGQSSYSTQPIPAPSMPPVGYPYGPSPAPCGPVPYGNPYVTPYNYPGINPYSTPYGAACPTPYMTPYPMTRGPQDDRFFMGGFGSPFHGGWGWGGSPFYGGWGWGGSPFFGGWGWGGNPSGWRAPSSCSGSYPY